jgi:hypothetical protein
LGGAAGVRIIELEVKLDEQRGQVKRLTHEREEQAK